MPRVMHTPPSVLTSAVSMTQNQRRINRARKAIEILNCRERDECKQCDLAEFFHLILHSIQGRSDRSSSASVLFARASSSIGGI